MDEGRIFFNGSYRVKRRLQHIILDLDEIDCLTGCEGCIGSHGGHGLAEMADHPAGQYVFIYKVKAHPVLELIAREHGIDAGKLFRCRRIYGDDAGTGMRAPLHFCMQHSRHGQITGIKGRAGELFDRIEPLHFMAYTLQRC